ncbi:MAG TPA: FadR/GntR family transcriptional regulator [Burkholderiaceae bacterium]|nr:FadR/GntR family transcriptional regulator [Burkholderiaceae bacterium]
MQSRADHATYATQAEGKSQHARIVSELGLAIVGGALRPGDKLPPEPQLLERYDISRSVLREAVRVLAAKGLVMSRQRAGASVRQRNEWHMLDPDVLYWLIQTRPPRDFVQTLLEVRRIFEPAAAALAARAASAEQLHAIEAAYEGMAAAKTADELLEPDLAFHRRIAEATGNDLLAYIGNMLSLALRESIILSSQAANSHELSLSRHRAILTALQARDSLSAHRATLVQLEETGDDLSAVLAADGRLNLA